MKKKIFVFDDSKPIIFNESTLLVIKKIEEKCLIEFAKETINWLKNLECPKCKEKSRIDYGLKKCYNEPIFICLNCKKIFKIKLQWRKDKQ